MRRYALVAALIALAVVALALVGGGEVQASTMPDSQAVICPAALDRIRAPGDDRSDSDTIGRVVDLLFLGWSDRPDTWRFRYHRSVDSFTPAMRYAAQACPNFAPYNGPLPGHLRLSPRLPQGGWGAA